MKSPTKHQAYMIAFIYSVNSICLLDVAGHIIIQIIKPKRYLRLGNPEEVKVFFSFGEGDCWMSWGFFFLFPMCSPH